MEVISDTPRDGSLKEALLKIYGEDVCVTDRKAIHGGDANEAYRLFLSNGETLFLKANIIERADFFRAEAEGMSDEKGLPMLIDPAVYVGCNEADIAMTELFGGFDKRFYDSYFEFMGMIPGYADRRDLYNLYHLLNHLNLFGSSYLYAVIRIIDRYS